MSEQAHLWTVGHSNHTTERFMELLSDHAIEVVADVRSAPYSAYARHFGQESLRRSLRDAEVAYLFIGHELGGRPPEPDFYDEAGHVLYDELADTDRFRGGLRRLAEGARRHRVALMCSEENPSFCHRRLLITRALSEAEPDISVRHIRGTGQTISEDRLAKEVNGSNQPGLFETNPPWRSNAPVPVPHGRPASARTAATRQGTHEREAQTAAGGTRF